MTERFSGDDYEDRGPSWGMAWDILAEGCEVPPSLEEFEHGLELQRSRRRVPLSVQEYARFVATNYQRIR